MTKVALGLDIRKLAHIGLFALLGITAIGLTRCIFQSSIICFAYAIFDEVHQLFVVGRTANSKDVLIDSIGFGVVLVMWEITALSVNYRKRKRIIGDTVVMEERHETER